MGMLARKLRIGEKIGFGFGIVGLLFLGVVWQYHDTLQTALTEYRQLDDIYGTRKSRVLAIENNMLRGQRAEKSFVLTRDETFAGEVISNLEQARTSAAAMQTVDGVAAPTKEQLIRLIDDYGQRFQAVVEAWRTRGLDHDSGLQGNFRNSIHELESMAGELDVDRLYLLLLQVRRGEKDLGLRREDQYRGRVLQLIEDFSDEVASSDLSDGLKARLFHEIEAYREGFGEFAEAALSNSEIHGGKGPFRETAHRIEALLEEHYLSGLGEQILQVRRREKDYLLRHDKQYVRMAISELDRIAAQVEGAAISQAHKTRFTGLLENYRRDFLALVAQDDRISHLSDDMSRAVAEIVGMVEDNVRAAGEAMNAMRIRIDETTDRSELAMLWVTVVATLLGIFLAFAITLPIVRPLRKMAGLLDQLASEDPVEQRMPFFPEGRDEVNAMAGSVNTMMDHKANFMDWWKAAMRETDACERLTELMRTPGSTADRKDAEQELMRAILARKELLWEQYHKVHQLNDWIVDRVEGLLRDAPPKRSETALNTIRYSAKAVRTIMEMASAPKIQGGAAD
jgi:methyl-accepting chemotaxis protein